MGHKEICVHLEMRVRERERDRETEGIIKHVGQWSANERQVKI